MKFNWLMVLPFVLFLGIAGIWLWQLQNNQFALQQGVDTTALRSAQQGHPAPDLNLDPLADKTAPDPRHAGGAGPDRGQFLRLLVPALPGGAPGPHGAGRGGPAAIRGELQRPGRPGAVSFLQELGDPYDAIGRDDRAGNGINWGIVAMPETFFIDASGTVVLHFRGPVTRRAIENQIAPALAEAGLMRFPTSRPSPSNRRGPRHGFAGKSGPETPAFPPPFPRLFRALLGRSGRPRTWTISRAWAG
jgi:cytochrome c biogenesis protein CcmG/thiol:disulfide interchange protein DsbE